MNSSFYPSESLSTTIAIDAKSDADPPSFFDQLSIPIYEITSLEKKMTALFIPNAIQITTRQAKYTFASFLSRDTTFDVIYNIWRLARPEDGASGPSSGRASVEGLPNTGSITGSAVTMANSAVSVAPVPAPAAAAAGTPVRKATQCTCGKEGKHYSETAMEMAIPGTPEKIHNLIFASGFIKDFMAVNQKLLGVFALLLHSVLAEHLIHRYPNLGLVACHTELETANAQHVVHQALKRLVRPEADQMRA